ncbi:myb family transcription factor EFM [Coffea eugenioides]|uniref:myb family transcription factor EFM n=1 Tax=Coffea eugenioides TaxID=49369 RepID=UPI000F6073C4|nr:myb family transcription factor EFM [Coffea eugenioides]
MMASPSELSLDCKPHSYSMLLKSVGEQSDQAQKLEEFLSRLEEERLKIDAFKRELPLCMQLLTNAMEASRQQLQSYRANQVPKPLLEEFIPLKYPSSEGSDKAPTMSDKANWMTSAQLWSQASDQGTKQQSPVTSPKGTTDIGFGAVNPKQVLDNKQRNGGGAFHPFSKDRSISCPSHALRAIPDLALASSPDKDHAGDKKIIPESDLRRESSCRVNSGSGVVLEQGKGATTGQADSQTNSNPNTTSSQTHRKARRCWSPDLHRRFVNALQMLGGSQVATPKQIRELMKVDGLTNDEVKSHLQKYRLHTRRPSPSSQAAVSAQPQLVVLGGIWVPPEYATAAAAAHGGAPAALYGAHPTTHASAHYCATPVPQEFYPAQTAPPQPPHHQLHHHPLHNQLHVYKPPSQTQSSPESDVRGNGDRSESIEDGKSDSSSWKVDSNGENNAAERKVLVLREDGEESNGSEITLKF